VCLADVFQVPGATTGGGASGGVRVRVRVRVRVGVRVRVRVRARARVRVRVNHWREDAIVEEELGGGHSVGNCV
jgi:hypothetical protein